MADKLASVILKYQVDKNSLKQVERSTAQVNAGVAELRGELNAISPAASKAGKGIENAVKSAEKQVNRTRKAVEDLDQALTDVEKRKRITEAQGDVSTGLGAGASVVGAFGGGGALSEGLRIGGDIAGLLEYKDRLVAGAKELIGTGAQAAANLTALGVGAVALAGIAVAIDRFNKSVQQASTQLEQNIQVQSQYYQDLQTLTTENARLQVEAFQNTAQGLRDEKEALDLLLTQSENEIDNAFGGLAPGVQLFVETFSTLPTEQLRERLTALGGELSGAETGVNLYTRAIEENAFAANDAARLLEADNARVINIVQQRAAMEARVNELLLTGTIESVNARRAVLERDIANIRNELDMLSENGQAGSQRFTDLNTQMRNLGEELGLLSDNMFQAEVLIRSGAEEAEKRRMEEIDRIVRYELEREKRLIDAQTRFNADMETITNRGLEQRAALEQKYADQLVSIAEKAADESAAALQRLEEAQASAGLGLQRGDEDAATQLQRDRLQSQIDYQREEADSYKSHLQDLENIRRNAQDEEFDLVLNRDFAGLFKRRRQTTRELEDAQKNFNLQREDRLEAFNRENEDQARQFEFERQDRLTNYQRELADAQAQFNQERQQAFANQQAELAQASQAYQRERSELQNKQTQELNLRRTAYQQELQLAAQTYQQRNALQAKFDQAMLAQAQKTLDAVAKGAGKAGSIAPSSGGGSLTLTPQQGNFSGASSDQSFSSSVNKTMNAGGMTFNVFDSGNPQKIVDVLNGALKQYFGLN